jgi:predicted aspartyl protease
MQASVFQGRLMLRTIALLGSGLMMATVAHAETAARQRMPTAYEAGHFYAVPKTAQGKTMRLLVDTGGAGGSGWYVVDPIAAKRLGLNVADCALDGEKVQVIPSISFLPGNALPASANTPCHSVALVVKGIGRTTDRGDGLLGAGYLPGHIWTFDYPGHALWLEPTSWQPPAGAHRTALGFPVDGNGHPSTGMARITLSVDGQPLDLLLDTGATAKPTDAGKQASGISTVNGMGTTSYITTSVMNRWHQQHPDWRMVAKGDDLFGAQHATRLIEVPRVDIAGWTLGPIWFTERPDANFHDYMSQYTDKPVEGSAGANVFASFRMTIDYPARAAWFICAIRCEKSK